MAQPSSRGSAGPRRVVFHRHTSSGWLVLTALLLLGMTVWATTTQPEPGPVIAVVLTATTWTMLGVLYVRPPTEVLETTAIMRSLLSTRRIDLTTAASISINRSWNGGCFVIVQPHRGFRAYLLLAIWTDLARRGLTADQLETLADILDDLPGNNVAPDVRRRLTQQADHLRNGGSLQDSPLRAR